MSKWWLLSLVVLSGCKAEPAVVQDAGTGGSQEAKAVAPASAGSARPGASAVAPSGSAAGASGKGPVWDSFLAAHPEAKGLSTLLVGDNRKRVEFIGRANLPKDWAGQAPDETGKPAYFALQNDGDFPRLWFPASSATFRYTGALVSLGEPKPRPVVANYRSTSGHGGLVLIETPDTLAQGAYWVEGGFSPVVFSAIPTPDKKASLLAGFVAGPGQENMVDFDLAVFAFVKGVFRPLLTVARGERPDWASDTANRAERSAAGPGAWLWVSPLPVVQKSAGDELVLSVYEPDGMGEGHTPNNCKGSEDYKKCKFTKREYRYDAAAGKMVPNGAGVPVVQALVAVKR